MKLLHCDILSRYNSKDRQQKPGKDGLGHSIHISKIKGGLYHENHIDVAPGIEGALYACQLWGSLEETILINFYGAPDKHRFNEFLLLSYLKAFSKQLNI